MEAYEMPWRPNFELGAATAWGVSAAAGVGMSVASSLPALPWQMGTGIAVVMGAYRGVQGWRNAKRRRRLLGRDVPHITIEELAQRVTKAPDRVYLGRGFQWDHEHCQLVYEINKRSRGDILPKNPKRAGAVWIHGLDAREVDVEIPLPYMDVHTLLLGTTGAGKTRSFDIMIAQAILRGEAVFVIDPKGDKGLKALMKAVCEYMGQPERFLSWHPGFAEDSVRLDPLHSFGRGTEVASRIAALMPGEGTSASFKSYSQMALTYVGQGLILTGKRPSLVSYKSYLEGTVEELVLKCVGVWAGAHLSDGSARLAAYTNGAKNKAAAATKAIEFYHAELKPVKPNADLEGLLGLFVHDRAHFSKMIATLIPILTQLTAGDLATLLSPEPQDGDTRPITDTANIIRMGQVAYIGLDSLSDNMVGSAVGQILLADLAAVAGERYNYGAGLKPVNVFVDEAAEVLCDPYIQVLNKGRGALIRSVLATQTLADFEARLGNKAKAMQILGNVNNMLVLRVQNTETQQYVAETLPETKVHYLMRTQGQNTQSNPLFFGANAGERLMEDVSPLVPATLLGELPNLEFFVRQADGSFWKGFVPIVDLKEAA
ncbi:conjugative transfer system coupling protein TraD [Azospirillum sp. sgz302134]